MDISHIGFGTNLRIQLHKDFISEVNKTIMEFNAILCLLSHHLSCVMASYTASMSTKKKERKEQKTKQQIDNFLSIVILRR
jgi:hypothetical protein